MEIEDELSLLWNMREGARDFPCDLKDSLAALYAPRKTAIEEIALLFRMLAEGEGFPARCASRACKRANACLPGDPGSCPLRWCN